MANIETIIFIVAVIVILDALLRRAHSDIAPLQSLIAQVASLQKQIITLQTAQAATQKDAKDILAFKSEAVEVLGLVLQAQTEIMTGSRNTCNQIEELQYAAQVIDDHHMEITVQMDEIRDDLASKHMRDREEKRKLIESASGFVGNIEDAAEQDGASKVTSHSLARFGVESRRGVAKQVSMTRLGNTATGSGGAVKVVDVGNKLDWSFDELDWEKERARRKMKLGESTTNGQARSDSGYEDDGSKESYELLEDTISASGFEFQDERSGYGESEVGLISGKEGMLFGRKVKERSFV